MVTAIDSADRLARTLPSVAAAVGSHSRSPQSRGSREANLADCPDRPAARCDDEFLDGFHLRS